MLKRIVTTTAVLAVVLIGNTAVAFAAINNGGNSGKDPGIVLCYDWCNSHNKTTNSILKCEAGCDKYYGPHGPGGTHIQ